MEKRSGTFVGQAVPPAIFAVCAAALLLALQPGPAAAQGVDRQMLLHPPADSWPTFFGDYSGRRFSPLKEINSSNVKDLSLEWATRFTPGPAGTAVSIKSPMPLSPENVSAFAPA